MTRDPTAGFARATGAIVVIGLALRLVYVLVPGVRPDLGFDGTWYALQAGSIGDGIGYVDPYRFYSLQGAFATAHFPPLWPGLLSLVYDLGFTGRNAYRVTGALVGTATIVLTAGLGRTLVDARTGLVAASVVAFSPFMIAADGSLMAESLFTALVTGAVLVGIGARRTGRLVWFAGLGLLLGLATLTRGDGLVVALVLAPVVACGAAGTWPRRLGRLTLVAVLFAVTLVPWAVRNQDAVGDPVVLASNSGTLISGANCAATYAGRDIGGWDAACARAVTPNTDDELARADAQRDAGLRYIRAHVPRAAAVAVVRVIRGWGIWNPDTLLDAEVVESRTRWLQAMGWVASLVILVAAVSGAVRLLRTRAEMAELLAVVGAATLVLATSWGNQRFRLVAMPELAVLAAVTFVALRDRRRSGSVSLAA